ARVIRSASATLPKPWPSAVHIQNHLPGYAVTDRLPLIVRATLVACLQASTGVLENTMDSIKVFHLVLQVVAWHGARAPS
ncbi:MAG: hypothetical protein WBQ71_13675, partial [Trebonia sp.]